MLWWWWKILLWCYVGASLWSRCWMQPPLLLPLQHRYTSLFEILWRRQGWDGVIIFERGAWSSIYRCQRQVPSHDEGVVWPRVILWFLFQSPFFVDSEWLVDRGIFAFATLERQWISYHLITLRHRLREKRRERGERREPAVTVNDALWVDGECRL